MIDVWNWFLWCKNEIQVLAQVFLKTPTLHAVTAEVIELNNRKNLKKTSFISSQRKIMKHETRAAKSEKALKNYTGSNPSWKLPFFSKFSTLNRGGWNVRKNGGGSKQSYVATSREDIREAHTILVYRFTDSLCSLLVFTPQSISNVLTRSGLLSFLSILVHFPKSKL